jgi:hypothetical protein
MFSADRFGSEQRSKYLPSRRASALRSRFELSGSHGYVSSTFNLSPQLTLGLTQYFGGNSGHPDSSSYTDGRAGIESTIDRPVDM